MDMDAGQISDTKYQAHRLNVPVETSFDDFRRRYEAAVPAYNAEDFNALVEANASWSDVLDLMDRSAPFGFLNYWSIDTQPMMSLAGATARCVEYMMGNHTIAERMFRHDPTVMMYAPLRSVITSDRDAFTSFSIEQPSSVFSSFGDDDIAAVGVELDRKVAGLLAHLDAPVPPALLEM
jgi:hypothetical protein